jgi:putative phage-type endonuclease
MKKLELIQGTPEWLAYRKNGIGGSDIASIASIPGAYKSRSAVLREKLGFDQKQLSSFQEALFASGHAWEDSVRTSVETSLGVPLAPLVIEAHDDPRFFASLDGWDDVSKTVLEVKSTGKESLFQNLAEGVVWPIWQAQIQWALYCTGGSRALLACVLDQSGDVIIHEIQPDLNMQALLVGVALDFLRELDAAKRLAVPDRHIKEIEKMKRVLDRVSKRAKVIEDRMKTMAESVLGISGITRLETDALTIAYQERAGAIQYKNIEALKGVDLEQYRGKPSKFVTIKLKGASENE